MNMLLLHFYLQLHYCTHVLATNNNKSERSQKNAEATHVGQRKDGKILKSGNSRLRSSIKNQQTAGNVVIILLPLQTQKQRGKITLSMSGLF